MERDETSRVKHVWFQTIFRNRMNKIFLFQEIFQVVFFFSPSQNLSSDVKNINPEFSPGEIMLKLLGFQDVVSSHPPPGSSTRRTTQQTTHHNTVFGSSLLHLLSGGLWTVQMMRKVKQLSPEHLHTSAAADQWPCCGQKTSSSASEAPTRRFPRSFSAFTEQQEISKMDGRGLRWLRFHDRNSS